MFSEQFVFSTKYLIEPPKDQGCPSIIKKWLTPDHIRKSRFARIDWKNLLCRVPIVRLRHDRQNGNAICCLQIFCPSFVPLRQGEVSGGASMIVIIFLMFIRFRRKRERYAWGNALIIWRSPSQNGSTSLWIIYSERAVDDQQTERLLRVKTILKLRISRRPMLCPEHGTF